MDTEQEAKVISTEKANDSSEGSDDESPPQLSAHALAALQEFYAEEAALEQHLALGEGVAPVRIKEDWQLSQFWYDETTSLTLAEEAIRACSCNKRIACISCPTLFSKLQEIKPHDVTVVLLEYDRRFEIYGDSFCFYDYNHPLSLPPRLAQQSFGLVVVDPPYLSEECLRKTSETVQYLAKDKILLCTGAVMEELASELLNVTLHTDFIPRHDKNLANEFRCFSNYDSCLVSAKIETKIKDLPKHTD